MHDFRPTPDRGPAGNSALNRFCTTYAASYRPYDETRRGIPVRCVANPPPNVNGSPTNQITDDSLSASRGARMWPITSTFNPVSCTANSTGVSHAPYQSTIGSTINSSVGQSDNPGTWRPWNSNTEPITDKQRIPLSEPELSVSNLSLSANETSKGPTTTSGINKRNFTSTYNAVVSDSLNPCSTIAYENNCSKDSTQPPQTISLYCAPRPRTLPTVAPSFSSLNKSENCSDSTNKTGPNNRTLSISPTTYSSPFQLDFNQMFSQIARINNHLYLSSLSAITPERLRQYGITLLVSAMIDPPPGHIRNSVSSTMHVSVEDVEGANLRAHFDRVGDRIAAENRRGGRTLVHCMAGVSRSSSLVLAYLVRHMNMSLAEAYQHVRTIRPCIQPNPSFWRQLLDYEERIRGSRSIRLLPSVGYGGIGNPSFRSYSNNRTYARSNYSDMFSRTDGDLIPYRPLGSVYSIDSGKPFIGCWQP